MAPRIPFAFAATGDTTSVPDTSSGTELSWKAGWSQAYELAPEDPGYREIDRGQHNFLWNAITANIKEWQEQTFPEIVSTINYPVGSIVAYSGVAYVKFQNSDGAISNPAASNDWKVFNGLSQVENRLKGNQNWNIPGRTGHPLPDATPRDYQPGDEIAFGIFCQGQPIIEMTMIDGVVRAKSGFYSAKVSSAKSSDFAGIKLENGSIRRAGSSSTTLSNGVAFVKESGAESSFDINVNFTVLNSLGIADGAHKFAGCSELPGVWPDVSDEESANAVLFNKEYASVPIGSEVAFDTPPPTNDPRFRFVRLTADDIYNSGLLNNKVISGAAPNLVVKMTVNSTLSPINGQQIEMLNTMGAIPTPGLTSGTIIQDAVRNVTGTFLGSDKANPSGATGAFSSSVQTSVPAGETFTTDAKKNRINFDLSSVVPTAERVQVFGSSRVYYKRIY